MVGEEQEQEADMDLVADDIIETQTIDNVIYARFLSGRIRDDKRIFLAFESLDNYVNQHAGVKMVLDLTNIEYLSSAGLGFLVGLLKKFRLGDGMLRLCGLRETILEIFEIMRLTQVFDIYPTREEALQAFGIEVASDELV